MEKIKPKNVTGVAETMLWPLHHRASVARNPNGLFKDPEAIRIVDSLDYNFERNFGTNDFWLIQRARAIDELLRKWLIQYPEGQVVALGEGLETQFQRVDNGKVNWLSVDLPEAMNVRRRLIPDAARHRNLACSALDFKWMDAVPVGKDIFVTAAGLLMYLKPEEVRHLVIGIAERFPNAQMAFDTAPRWYSEKTLRGMKTTAHYTVPPMPWGLNRDEIPTLKSWHRNIAEVKRLSVPGSVRKGLKTQFLALLVKYSSSYRNRMPAFVHLRFAPSSEL
jgi:O-methyltransferase involved in polyketide biosynthesis